MAVTCIEQHTNSDGYLARYQVTAQGDTFTLIFPKIMRQLAAQANILAGGNLTAFTVTGLIGLNATITPVEAGFTLSEANLYDLKSDESPFMTLKVTTTLWTGASTLEITVGGVY